MARIVLHICPSFRALSNHYMLVLMSSVIGEARRSEALSEQARARLLVACVTRGAPFQLHCQSLGT